MGLSFAGVTLLLLAGCSSGLTASGLTAPLEERGFLGKSVSVQCHYKETYQNYQKYWCKGEEWKSCSKVVETTKREVEKVDRVSIRDNRTERTFTVTMENLTRLDEGIYWCGINRKGHRDPYSRVHVTVLSDLSTAATVTNGSLGTAISTAIPTRQFQSSPVSILMVLLPVTLLILILFLIGASLLTRQLMLKKKKAAEAVGAIAVSSEAGASSEGDVTYAAVEPKPRKLTTTVSSPLSAQAEQSPEREENSNAVPGRTDVFYTTLQYPRLDEQAIYTNMDRTSNQPLEPTVYCEVKKK